MINETVILLSPFEDCSKHRLAKHIEVYLRYTTTYDLYFYQPLQKLFSKVIVYDFVKRMTEVGVKGINEEVIALVRKEHPKCVLWISSAYEFQESTFRKIRQEGSIVIGWFGDDENRFEDYSRWWIPYLDYCVTNYIGAVPRFRELGARVIHAIPGTGIAIDRDWSKIEENYDVSFVGRKKINREQYINEFKNRNIPVHAFGDGWTGFIPFEETIEISKTSRINLSFTAVTDTRRQIKGRIFEVCLAGGFLLTEYVPGIEKYFEIDSEIVCFDNVNEMIDKVTYYLTHDAERRAIAQAGWKRATSEYTSFHMVSKIFREVVDDIAAKGQETGLIPPKSRTPNQMRKAFSDYYLPLVLAFSLERYKNLAKDALLLSLIYNPFNIRAWGCGIIALSPSFLRHYLFRLSRALNYRLSSIPYLYRLSSLPYRGKMTK